MASASASRRQPVLANRASSLACTLLQQLVDGAPAGVAVAAAQGVVGAEVSQVVVEVPQAEVAPRRRHSRPQPQPHRQGPSTARRCLSRWQPWRACHHRIASPL